MVIGRAEFFAVGGVKIIALLHLSPAQKVLHGSRKATVTMEEDVQQHLAGTEALDVQWHIVIYFVDGQAHVQFLYLLVVGQHLDGGIVLPLLYRQQQIFVAYFHALHGVTLSQHLWLSLC